MAKLTEIQPADVSAGAEAVDGLQDSLAGSLQSDLLSGFIETLRERMGVSINPRVVVIEYNARYPPPILFNITYDDAHCWNGDDYMGGE